MLQFGGEVRIQVPSLLEQAVKPAAPSGWPLTLSRQLCRPRSAVRASADRLAYLAEHGLHRIGRAPRQRSPETTTDYCVLPDI
jgi:hypothetical protein